MNIRTALITGAAGFMLTAGAVTDASAQYVKTGSRNSGYYGNNGYYGNSGYNNGYMGVRQAQRVVARAYRDILGREVDQSGLREYTNAMVNRGWSEDDVRRALLSSPEYARMNGGYGRYNRSSRSIFRNR
jgi:hypothetical protein